MNTIDADTLRSLLRYDPESGQFTWVVSRKGRNLSGPAGYIERTTGYRTIRINGRGYRAHRLAWLYVHGRFPGGLIDHIDGNRDNNKWTNLREATPTQNQFNRKVKCTSSTGRKGVSISSRTGRYQVQIKIGGVKTFVGYFDTIEEGARAYNAIARKIHGEFLKAS